MKNPLPYQHLLACFFAVTTLSLCLDKKADKIKADPNTLQPQATKNILPKIVAEEAQFNFGQVEQGKSVEHTFKIFNKGKSELVIEKAAGS